jgi:prepilin-type processing-associated H-X9-DG protein
MLLPALGRAREAAKRASCKNRMKQTSLIILLYVDENNGRFLAKGEVNAPEPTRTVWSQRLIESKVAKSRVTFSCPSLPLCNTGYDYSYAFRHPHTVDQDNYGKSKFDPGTAFMLPQGVADIWYNSHTLYIPVRSKSPSQVFTITDSWIPGSDSQYYTYWDSMSVTTTGIVIPHLGSSNVAFIDGHVVSLKPNDFPSIGINHYFKPNGTTKIPIQ